MRDYLIKRFIYFLLMIILVSMASFTIIQLPEGDYIDALVNELRSQGDVVDEEIIRTPLGGFINHSENPNCRKWLEGSKYYMKTIKPIKKGEELFLKYTFYKVG